MRCSCDDAALGVPPKNRVASYDVQLVDGVPEKAKIWPGTGRVQIDKRFWASLSSAQQTAVLAHELAHDEMPDACEECADARAGARMRHEGLSAQLATAALGSVVGHRRTSASVLYGWKVADAALASSGTHRQAGDLENSEGTIAVQPDGQPGYRGAGADTTDASASIRRPGRAPGVSHLDDGTDFEVGSPFGAEDDASQQSIGTPSAGASGNGPVLQVSGGQVNSASQTKPKASSGAAPLPPSKSPPNLAHGVAGVLLAAGVVILVVVIVRAVRKG